MLMSIHKREFGFEMNMSDLHLRLAFEVNEINVVHICCSYKKCFERRIASREL